jgi:hypothetical protein
MRRGSAWLRWCRSRIAGCDSYDAVESGNQFNPSGRFGHEPMCPESSTLHKRGSVLDSQEHDLGCRGDSTYLAGGGDAVHYRHVDVEQNDVGFQLDDFLDGFLAIFGIATNLKRMPIEERTNSRSGSEMIIDNEDSSWHLGSG